MAKNNVIGGKWLTGYFLIVTGTIHTIINPGAKIAMAIDRPAYQNSDPVAGLFSWMPICRTISFLMENRTVPINFAELFFYECSHSDFLRLIDRKRLMGDPFNALAVVSSISPEQ